MDIVTINRMTVSNIPGKTHCWAPIINGKAIEYNREPPFSIRAAKIAAAKKLCVPVRNINFKINR